MIFRAHRPHDSRVKSWFAYCRDDGFVVSRNSGRIDRNKKWNEIEEKWVQSFKNREEIDGFSILKAVNYDEEWCAEAYLQPNYDNITEEEFKKAVEEYYIYKALYDTKIKSGGENNAEIE